MSADTPGDRPEPEFEEPEDGTVRATKKVEDLGGLPDDNPFSAVVQDLRDDGESWRDICDTMEDAFDIVDEAALEEGWILQPDWKLAIVVPEEEPTTGDEYERIKYVERPGETVEDALAQTHYDERDVDWSETEQVGVSKVS